MGPCKALISSERKTLNRWKNAETSSRILVLTSFERMKKKAQFKLFKIMFVSKHAGNQFTWKMCTLISQCDDIHNEYKNCALILSISFVNCSKYRSRLKQQAPRRAAPPYTLTDVCSVKHRILKWNEEHFVRINGIVFDDEKTLNRDRNKKKMERCFWPIRRENHQVFSSVPHSYLHWQCEKKLVASYIPTQFYHCSSFVVIFVQ